MPIRTAKELLIEATDGKYAVGASNVTNITQMQAVIEAHVDHRAPLIIQTNDTPSKFLGKEVVVAFSREWDPIGEGAIRAGIDILLEELGLRPDDLERLIIAGAFGTYIDMDSAIRVGMFPDLALQRFQQVGNAAGAGAKDLLVSKELRRVAEEIMVRVEYVELTTPVDFQKVFMERLYF